MPRLSELRVCFSFAEGLLLGQEGFRRHVGVPGGSRVGGSRKARAVVRVNRRRSTDCDSRHTKPSASAMKAAAALRVVPVASRKLPTSASKRGYDALGLGA